MFRKALSLLASFMPQRAARAAIDPTVMANAHRNTNRGNRGKGGKKSAHTVSGVAKQRRAAKKRNNVRKFNK